MRLKCLSAAPTSTSSSSSSDHRSMLMEADHRYHRGYSADLQDKTSGPLPHSIIAISAIFRAESHDLRPKLAAGVCAQSRDVADPYQIAPILST